MTTDRKIVANQLGKKRRHSQNPSTHRIHNIFSYPSPIVTILGPCEIQDPRLPISAIDYPPNPANRLIRTKVCPAIQRKRRQSRQSNKRWAKLNDIKTAIIMTPPTNSYSSGNNTQKNLWQPQHNWSFGKADACQHTVKRV